MSEFEQTPQRLDTQNVAWRSGVSVGARGSDYSEHYLELLP